MSIKHTGSLDKALNRLVSSKEQHVEVGVMQGSVYPDGTNVATVAYKNEYGFKNIPSRPFFRDTIKNDKKQWSKLVAKGVKAGYSIERILSLAGLQMQQDIQLSIMTFTTPKNADSTIRMKGFDAPLRHTLLMHDSITFNVKDS